MACTRRVVQEERFLRRDRLGVTDELDRLVGDVVGEVVAVFGRARLVDGVVVVDEVREPLVRLRAEETVEALEPASGRPVATRRRQVHLVFGAEVPLADRIGVPAEPTENLGEHSVFGRDRPARARKADRGFGDARHAVTSVVPARQQTRTGRRAQSGRVPLRVAQAVRRDAVEVRCIHRAAITVQRREPHVVEHDVHHVRRAGGCLRRFERRPVGCRVPDIDVDGAFERLSHSTILCLAYEFRHALEPSSPRGDHHRDGGSRPTASLRSGDCRSPTRRGSSPSARRTLLR